MAIPNEWYWAKLHIQNVMKGVGYYFIDPQNGRSFQLIVITFDPIPDDEIARQARAANYGATSPVWRLQAHEEIFYNAMIPPKARELFAADFEVGDPDRAQVMQLSPEEIAAYGLPVAPPWVATVT